MPRHWNPEKLIVHYTTFSIKSWIPDWNDSSPTSCHREPSSHHEPSYRHESSYRRGIS
ncbi:hypothetical protein [Wolbachia endosymbiont (group A) of Beris morrisii]|uniref:hypothetical protein n=1 Tax=Wolbachia endosymbiont (group A) of Beris morrisii TaxID=3066139 RepID=UPI00333FBB71